MSDRCYSTLPGIGRCQLDGNHEGYHSFRNPERGIGARWPNPAHRWKDPPDSRREGDFTREGDAQREGNANRESGGDDRYNERAMDRY